MQRVGVVVKGLESIVEHLNLFLFFFWSELELESCVDLLCGAGFCSQCYPGSEDLEKVVTIKSYSRHGLGLRDCWQPLSRHKEVIYSCKSFWWILALWVWLCGRTIEGDLLLWFGGSKGVSHTVVKLLA